jgi:hypothetical protein
MNLYPNNKIHDIQISNMSYLKSIIYYIFNYYFRKGLDISYKRKDREEI